MANVKGIRSAFVLKVPMNLNSKINLNFEFIGAMNPNPKDAEPSFTSVPVSG